MINQPTVTRRRIAVTIASPDTAAAAVAERRTLACLSPSYSAAVAHVINACARRTGGEAHVRIFAIADLEGARRRPVIRRAWPDGVSARAAWSVAADLDVNCRDAHARP